MMFMCTWWNLLFGRNVPSGAFVCLCIFDFWQAIQLFVHWLTSLFISGQKNRWDTNFLVVLIPGWLRLWILLIASRRKSWGNYCRALPVLISHHSVLSDPGISICLNVKLSCLLILCSSASFSCAEDNVAKSSVVFISSILDRISATIFYLPGLYVISVVNWLM